ncbi:MAG: GTPase [Solibacillus sp.]
MTEENTIETLVKENPPPLQQLIDRLKPLHVILSQNSYVKDTTHRLKRIIDDSESQPMLLILGKERVGKTTLINSLLGRALFTGGTDQPTSINTFIRFGEQECIKAHFLDGVIATFDISKLHLITVSDTFSAQIIREHLDYIEVYIKHDLLKSVTIVDSVALEVGPNNTAYFSQTLLQRVDEVFWVLRSGSPATDDEINLLKKMETFAITPHFIVNAIDQEDGDITSFIESEKSRYGHAIGDIVPVSALQALEARKTHDMQLLIDSRITELTQLIHRIVSNKQKKTRHVTEQLIHWLERLRKEVEMIPTREPYISAFESVERHNSEAEFEFTRQQRDRALISSYEEEYQNVSVIFNNVQTLYQLLQTLASELYLRDAEIEKYEENAALYQQFVRDYRKLHGEYSMEYTRFEKQYKKLSGKSLEFPIVDPENEEFLKGRIATLNKMQQQCIEKLEAIQRYEGYVCENLYAVQNRLNDLAAKRLKSIVSQLSDLNIQRKNERIFLKSYVDKLSEFNCIVESQGFLRDAVLPYMAGEQLPLSEQEKQHVYNTIDCICAVDLTHQALYKRSTIPEPDDLMAQFEFESKYKLNGLSLTESDVKSDLPEAPKEINYALA